MRNIFFPHYLSGESRNFYCPASMNVRLMYLMFVFKLSDINNLLLIVCIENKKPKNLLYS